MEAKLNLKSPQFEMKHNIHKRTIFPVADKLKRIVDKFEGEDLLLCTTPAKNNKTLITIEKDNNQSQNFIKRFLKIPSKTKKEGIEVEHNISEKDLEEQVRILVSI